ncbi:MAG: hypothetical protein M3N26_06270, partial [Pseudomonadota bacterium]|nr:hypothetical protein [Pseudomonadota bacterium]
MGDPARPSGGPTRWNDLGRRAVSASILAPMVLACVWFGGPWFSLLALAGAAGLSVEWVAMCDAKPSTLPGMVVPICLVLATAAACDGRAAGGLAILAIGGVLVCGLGRHFLLAAGLI